MTKRDGGTVDTHQLEQLVTVIQKLSLARSLDGIIAIVCKAARALTNADGATFVLREDGRCYYVDEDAIGPLWKGKHLPLSTCVSGWVMEHKTTCVIEDVFGDSRVLADVYRPTFVKSLLIVPIRTLDPIGAIGNYWAERHRATENEIRLLQALADTTAVAMENVRMYEELETRVLDRTRRLEELNHLLIIENAERKRAEAEVRRQAITDALTGLLNRRGFFQNTGQRIREMSGAKCEWSIVFLDLDGLKTVNDNLGHEAGDKMIIAAANVIRAAFHGQIHARLGGDEFAVLLEGSDDIDAVVDKLQKMASDYMETYGLPFDLSLSVGCARFVPKTGMSLDVVLNRADKAMYLHKKGKRRARQPETPKWSTSRLTPLLGNK
jgi:diguanylate cyclase (GGDEF)-like protein